MTPEQRALMQRISDQAIDPALKLLPARMDSAQARVQLLAQGWQESGLLWLPWFHASPRQRALWFFSHFRPRELLGRRLPDPEKKAELLLPE